MGVFEAIFGGSPKSTAPTAQADLSREPRISVMRCPPTRSVYADELLPFVSTAIEAHRFGPRQSQVYDLLLEVKADCDQAAATTVDRPVVGISHEELYFITDVPDFDWSAFRKCFPGAEAAELKRQERARLLAEEAEKLPRFSPEEIERQRSEITVEDASGNIDRY